MKRLLLIGLLCFVAGITAQDATSSKKDADRALLKEHLPKLGKADTRNQAIADLLKNGNTATVIQIVINNICSDLTCIPNDIKQQAFYQSHKHASVLSSESFSQLRSFFASHDDQKLNRLARSEELFEQLFALKYPNESLQMPRQSAAFAASARPESINVLFCNLLINLIEHSITNPSEQRNREKQAEVITEILSMLNIMAQTMDTTEMQPIAQHIQQMSLYFYKHPEQQFLNFASIYRALAQRYGISEQHTATLEESITQLLSADKEHNKNTLQFAIRSSLNPGVSAKTKALVFEKAQFDAGILLSPAYEQLRSYIEYNGENDFLSHHAFYERSLKELMTALCARQGTNFPASWAALCIHRARSAQAARKNDTIGFLLGAIGEIEEIAQSESYDNIAPILTQIQQFAAAMSDEELLLWRLHANKMHARFQDDATYGNPNLGKAYAALHKLLASVEPTDTTVAINDASEKELYRYLEMLVDEASRDQGITSILNLNKKVNFALLLENSILSGVSAETRAKLLQKVEEQEMITESRELQKLRDLVKQEKVQAVAISVQIPASEKQVTPQAIDQRQQSAKKKKFPATKSRKAQRTTYNTENISEAAPVTPHDLSTGAPMRRSYSSEGVLVQEDKPVLAEDFEQQLLIATSTSDQTEHESASQETNAIEGLSDLLQKLRQIHLDTKHNTEAITEITQCNDAMRQFLQRYLEQPNVFMHMDILAQQIQQLPTQDRDYLEVSFVNYATSLRLTTDLSETKDIADIARQDDPRLWHYVTYLAARLGFMHAKTSLAEFHIARAQEGPLTFVPNEYRLAQYWLDIATNSTATFDPAKKALALYRDIEPMREQLRGVVDTRIMPLALHTLWQQRSMTEN